MIPPNPKRCGRPRFEHPVRLFLVLITLSAALVVQASDWRTQGGDPGLTKYSPDNIPASGTPKLEYKKRFYMAWTNTHGNFFYANNLVVVNGNAVLFANDALPNYSPELELLATRFNWNTGETLAKYKTPFFIDENPFEVDSHHFTNPVIWHTDGRIYSRRGGDGNGAYSLDPNTSGWRYLYAEYPSIDNCAFLQAYGDRLIFNPTGTSGPVDGPYGAFDISASAFATGKVGVRKATLGPWPSGPYRTFLHGDIPKVAQNISILSMLDISGGPKVVIAAVDIRDGKVKWQKSFPSDGGGLNGFNTGISDYWRFLATEDGHFAFFTRSGTPILHMLDIQSQKEQLKQTFTDPNERPLLAYHAGFLYAIGRSQQFKFDAKTGAVVWEKHNSFPNDHGYSHRVYLNGIPQYSEPIYRPVVLTDDTLWFVDGDNPAGPSGEPSRAMLVGLKTSDGEVAYSLDLKALITRGTEKFGLVNDVIVADGKLGILVSVSDGADPHTAGKDYAYQDLYVYTFGAGPVPAPSLRALPAVPINTTPSPIVSSTADATPAATSAPPANVAVPSVPTTLLAADMPTKTTGGARGTSWVIWSNGYVEGPANFPRAGRYRFVITARGEPAAGVPPNMELLIDQKSVKIVPVPSSSLTTYTIDADVMAGTHRVAIGFTNDLQTATEDRNLVVDRVAITPVR